MLKRIFNILTTSSLVVLGLIYACSPTLARKYTAGFIAFITMWLGVKRKRVSYFNIKRAFPKMSKLDVQRCIKESYINLAIVLCETCAMLFWSDSFIKKRLIFDNPEVLTRCKEKNSSVLLISGHFGNWELLAYNAGLILQESITIVVKPQKNYYVDKLLNYIRSKSGNKTIDLHNAARSVVNILRSNQCLALLIDQAAEPGKDYFVNFFDRPALIYKAPAQLALHFNSKIIFGCAERTANGIYRVVLKEIDYTNLNTENPKLELTQLLTSYLEKEIIKRPDLWTWQHKRWKYASSIT